MSYHDLEYHNTNGHVSEHFNGFNILSMENNINFLSNQNILSTSI
jgi:hypothetical protein